MSGLRSYARWLLIGYSIFLALALFSPTSERQSGAVTVLAHALQRVGVSATLASFGNLELLSNVVVIVPLTFLGSLVLTRWTWRDWTACAFLGAMAVELVQHLLLPGRAGAFSDVVANTLGALLGAVLVRFLDRRRRRHPAHR